MTGEREKNIKPTSAAGAFCRLMTQMTGHDERLDIDDGGERDEELLADTPRHLISSARDHHRAVNREKRKEKRHQRTAMDKKRQENGGQKKSLIIIIRRKDLQGTKERTQRCINKPGGTQQRGAGCGPLKRALLNSNR